VAGDLDRTSLMEVAVAETGLDDFGDVPFAEALDVLVDALNREAGLDAPREAAAAQSLTRLLVKRLRLVDDRTRHPAIADEVIEAPIFIVGLPRTGSTHLHGLLGQVEGVRTPRFWEMALPSPPPEQETFETDPRIAEVEAELAQTPAELQARHPFAARRPEQCNLLSDWTFMNTTPVASYHVPSYRDWLLDADHRPVFEAHQRTLQQLQWRTNGRWVLKYPKHLMALDALLEKYPDALFVWTHRDPAVVVPSVCSLTSFMRTLTSGPTDLQRFGRAWAALEELVAYRGVSVRDRMADADSRVIDVHYRDLMADQLGTVASILEFAGMSFSDRSRESVEAFIVANAKDRHGPHRYTAEEFGLDAARLRGRFAWYIDRFDVQIEELRS
jgi:Sulfotransferase family